MTFNVGDKVEVLDDSLKGIVTKIAEEKITIETSEGFEMGFDASELVKIEENQEKLIARQDIPISEIIKEKQVHKKPKSTRIKPKERNAPPMEVDLHIEKLVNSSRGMSNYDILTLQTDT
ncbi:MAG: DNA mismatch repair protein MutS, partial [Gillisia sp.]